MFAGSRKDPFLCSICRNVFSDPVTIPCGHNFCKTCITQHWKINVQCQCPSCKEVFYPKPKLTVNSLISEMVAQKVSSTRTKVALMICLVLSVCFVSYYKTCDAEEYPETEEPGEKCAEPEKLDSEIQHLIEMGRRTIERVKISVELNEVDLARIDEGLLDLNAVHLKVYNTFKEKLVNIHIPTTGFLNELTEEISELEALKSQVLMRHTVEWVWSFFLYPEAQGVSSDEL